MLTTHQVDENLSLNLSFTSVFNHLMFGLTKNDFLSLNDLSFGENIPVQGWSQQRELEH